MKKITPVRLVFFVPAVLIVVLILSACGGTEAAPRVPSTYIFNPGAVFTTNINDDDPRRVIRCSIIFEVVDEAAIEELAGYNAAIRNAVLIVLGQLTMEEVTTGKDLQEISQRLVEQVNDAIYSYIDLVIGAYFTEFVLA